MQSMGSTSVLTAERKRVEAVVETLAAIHNHGENLGELAHDARNMVTALSLYCDLLEEPGVLPVSHRHYGSELRLVAEASRRLVEKLSLLDKAQQADAAEGKPATSEQAKLFPTPDEPEYAADGLHMHSGWDPVSVGLIEDFREELLAAAKLLDVIAGPSVTVSVSARGGSCPIRMTSENLIRVLVNLVKNASESITGAGTIHLNLRELKDAGGQVRSLVLTVEDSGCGIAPPLLEKIFERGFTTHSGSPEGAWETRHQGAGLAITRAILEAAGGRIHAESGVRQGARLVMEFPVRAI